jgi:hypothetical protein
MLTTSMISKSVKPDLRDVFIFSFCFITPVDSSEFLTPTIQGDAGKQAGESPGFCAASRLALKFWITSFGLYLHLIQGVGGGRANVRVRIIERFANRGRRRAGRITIISQRRQRGDSDARSLNRLAKDPSNGVAGSALLALDTILFNARS